LPRVPHTHARYGCIYVTHTFPVCDGYLLHVAHTHTHRFGCCCYYGWFGWLVGLHHSYTQFPTLLLHLFRRLHTYLGCTVHWLVPHTPRWLLRLPHCGWFVRFVVGFAFTFGLFTFTLHTVYVGSRLFQRLVGSLHDNLGLHGLFRLVRYPTHTPIWFTRTVRLHTHTHAHVLVGFWLTLRFPTFGWLTPRYRLRFGPSVGSPVGYLYHVTVRLGFPTVVSPQFGFVYWFPFTVYFVHPGCCGFTHTGYVALRLR